jgi:hypothetical protein
MYAKIKIVEIRGSSVRLKGIVVLIAIVGFVLSLLLIYRYIYYMVALAHFFCFS